VIELPVGLAQWATQLSVLPGDLALALAPWVGRLSLAVGPLRSMDMQHSAEPDGYSGLSRRGPYERLVAAEWGIADVFPDEFIRRAASGEHLFLDLARREPRGAFRSIAIVSAGPAQLGAPRLAHLAALIVLARRAAVAGVRFSWGVLEDGEHRLIDGLDEAGIARLLGARTAISAGPDALQAWSTAIAGDAGTDFWVIGAGEDTTNAPLIRASRIIVSDRLEPGTRALDLEIDRRGPSARLRLELPPPELCARLLRDPFAQGGSTSRVASAAGLAKMVRFAPGGRRLILRLADDVFESWPVPSSPREKVGTSRRWAPPADHVMLSVGIGKRSILAVTAQREDPTILELSYSNNPRVRIKFSAEAFPSEVARRVAEGSPLPLGTCAFIRVRDGENPILHIQILGRIFILPGFRVWPKAGSVTSALPVNSAIGEVPRPVAATAFFRTSFVYAEREGRQLYVTEATASGNKRVLAVSACEDADVHFGFSMPAAESWGVAAVATDAQTWMVAAPSREPAPITSVVPVVGVCRRGDVSALLTRPHPYRLAWITADAHEVLHRELLPTASAAIVAVAVCPELPNIAWLTEAGEVVVYSMAHKAVLFRRTPGDSQ